MTAILRAHVGPVLGDRTIAAVAQSRDDVIDLLTIRLGEGSNSRRKIARALITGVLDEAVRAGEDYMHRCGDITLPDNGGNGNHDDFVFPAHAQLLMLANGSEDPPVTGIRYPLTIWLMRGCGLRIEEMLAVKKSCFRDGGTVLRVFEQASSGGDGVGAGLDFDGPLAVAQAGGGDPHRFIASVGDQRPRCLLLR